MNHDELSRLEDADRRTVFHSFTDLKAHAHGESDGPRIVQSGEGIYVVDAHGGRFIDAFAALYCVNVGYGRTEIAEAICEQAKKFAYFHTYSGYSNEPAIRLSEKLLELAPEGMSKVYYATSGSEANETQVKLVWYYNNVLGRPKKKKIIAREGAFHGSSIMAASLTGIPIYHETFDLPLPRVCHTMAPHYYWRTEPEMTEAEFSRHCADRLEAMIVREGPDTVAAFIAEPVMGNAGIVPPPQGYWKEVQRVLKKYDVLLIADEVVCGFGRLGANFGCSLYDIRPDFMTIGKGLTSAYLPLSGAIVGDKVWEVLEAGSDKFGVNPHGSTYSAHPTSAAAALANLEIIEREGLTANARDTGEYLLGRLRETFGDHPFIGDIRGAGMLAGLEFVADKEKKTRFDPGARVGARMAAACLRNGLIVRALPNGDVLGFAPPLNMTPEEVDTVVALAGKSIDAETERL